MANIIVVDDDLLVLDVVGNILERLRHQVWRLGNINDALALLEGRGHFDLAIVDLALKGQSGLDFVRCVRQKRPSFPIIVMSGYINAESTAMVDTLRAAGVTEVLSKPIAVAKLDAVVNAALGHATRRLPDPSGPDAA